eukprot:TRINITY_DN16699_c0_g2_i2.p1 TRINITY_DN16699_c0_g2~~TRINITY_DN16699_c0_g2_i2.p1  ORF type:complete len:316 (-),score=49.43 TRINITY_DN16699_c0_g2_i2:209-1156(-)
MEDGLYQSLGTPFENQDTPSLQDRVYEVADPVDPKAQIREAEAALKCNAGHSLNLAPCPFPGSQLCDRCERRIDSTFTYRCKVCDYDLCERCMASAKIDLQRTKEYWSKPPQQMQAIQRTPRDSAPAAPQDMYEEARQLLVASARGPKRPPWQSFAHVQRTPSAGSSSAAVSAGSAVVGARATTPRMHGEVYAKQRLKAAQVTKPHNMLMNSLPTPRSGHSNIQALSLNKPQVDSAAQQAGATLDEQGRLVSRMNLMLSKDGLNAEAVAQAYDDLDATEKFRLSTAMLVVRQMVNVQAPRVSRDAPDDKGRPANR